MINKQKTPSAEITSNPSVRISDKDKIIVTIFCSFSILLQTAGNSRSADILTITDRHLWSTDGMPQSPSQIRSCMFAVSPSAIVTVLVVTEADGPHAPNVIETVLHVGHNNIVTRKCFFNLPGFVTIIMCGLNANFRLV